MKTDLRPNAEIYPSGMYHRGSRQAFNNAIKLGLLSDNPSVPHHAGNYMYMHSMGNRDYFKNIDTREYLSVPYNGSSI